jgi:hypothetical protein
MGLRARLPINEHVACCDIRKRSLIPKEGVKITDWIEAQIRMTGDQISLKAIKRASVEALLAGQADSTRRKTVNSKLTLLATIEHMQDASAFRDLHWEGTFEDYLEIVRHEPPVARTAFQRMYDMIVSYGHTEYPHYRETLVHFHFFDDPFENGRDAVFGLDKPLMDLMRIFQSAARRYGTERRVLLLLASVPPKASSVCSKAWKLMLAPRRAASTRSTGSQPTGNGWTARCTKSRCI